MFTGLVELIGSKTGSKQFMFLLGEIDDSQLLWPWRSSTRHPLAAAVHH